jgi:hypothetical protein
MIISFFPTEKPRENKRRKTRMFEIFPDSLFKWVVFLKIKPSKIPDKKITMIKTMPNLLI